MALRVSVVKAAESALTAWLKSQLPDITFSTEWPDPGVAISPAGAVTILRVGSCDETDVTPYVMKQVNDAPPLTTANFYWKVCGCEQPLQLDIWATSEPRRDDILDRLGDALTAGKALTLSSAFFAAEGISTNQDPVWQGITLQLAAPWDHLVGSYLFEAPETSDTEDDAKRKTFRATYQGSAFFDRTVIRNSPRLLSITTPMSLTHGKLPPP